jgi:prepilin-type processing-associated H-X9-DG protein
MAGGLPAGWSIWGHFIYDYTGGGKKLEAMNTNASWKDHKYVAHHDGYICPSATYNGAHSFGSSIPDDGTIQGPHYAYSDMRYQLYGGGLYGPDTWLRPDDIPQPADVRMFCDCVYWHTHYHAVLDPMGNATYNDTPAWSRHRNGVNIGFWDGHGEFFTDAEIQGSDGSMDGQKGGF